MFTVEQKSMLAKLMATENIFVEHKNTRTAYFNIKTRTLTCPNWKDMNGDLYDLLLGHEISHALHTPASGWHDAIIEKGKKAKSFKHFLNVVEDARIEKFIKSKYPGLRKPMIKGYQELLKKDFFGISTIENINEIYLIDKLNLSAKLGTLLNIKFTDQEKPFVNRLEKVQTWNDVIKLSEDLYEYSKKEQKQGEENKQNQISEQMKELMDGGHIDDGEYEEDEDNFNDSDCDDDDEEDLDSLSDSDYDWTEQPSEDEDSEDEDSEDEDSEDEDSEDEDSEDGNFGNESKGKNSPESENEDDIGGGVDKDEFIPKCSTDEKFRENESKLLEEQGRDHVYVNIPIPNLKKIVVSADIVNKQIRQEMFDTVEKRILANKILVSFKKKNNDYIMSLVKEFEMKKAANKFEKSKVSDTGDIDLSKIYRYRLEDDIFKKMMKVEKGKSHGLQLLLDKSGSMASHIKGAIEQICILACFCRKVNIPFVAYSFTQTKIYKDQYNDHIKQPYFSQRDGDLRLSGLNFYEMLNSSMPANIFTQCLTNQLILANSLSNNHECRMVGMQHPHQENMGTTPLHESLITLRDLTRKFIQDHKLDIVNAVIIHDGDSDCTDVFYSGGSTNHFNFYGKTTITDKKENVSVRLDSDLGRRSLSSALMKWFQITTGCGVFGFYIVDRVTTKRISSTLYDLYYNKMGIKFERENSSTHILNLNKLILQFTEENVLESFNPGYSRFFFMPGNKDLEAQSTTMQSISGKSWTPARLLSAFKKIGKKKNNSRILVNKFISLIASKI